MREKVRIMIADDSSAIRKKIHEMLSAKRFEVIEAVDGIDCIIKVFKKWPSYIILDVKMPRMSGYQACRFLKNHPLTAPIPVMLLTAMDRPIDELWGYETGADLYRKKSGSIESLMEEVATEALKAQVLDFDAMREQEITEIDILESLNGTLDSKLFELTVLNEIAALAYHYSDISSVVNRCAQFLFKIFEYYIVGFSLVSDDGVKVYLCSEYEYGPFFDDFRTYVTDTLKKSGLPEADFEFNFGNMRLPSNFYENKEFVYISNPSEGSDVPEEHRIPGSVFFCYDKEKVESLKRVQFLLNQILLVINNRLLYQKVVDLSTIDELTRLYNRRKIFDVLRTERERAARYNLPLSAIMIDIDDFKKINDKYGHMTGDMVLKNVAVILKSTIRTVDYIGRFGGEEFIIVSPETTMNNAITLAERIRKVFESMIFEKVTERITLSLGVSSSDGTKEIDTLISEADIAMYEAKRGGKNTVRVFTRKGQ